MSCRKPLNAAIYLVLLFLNCGRAENGFVSESLLNKKQPGLDGLLYYTQELELRHKPIIIEFWATWCPPCKKSIPHLNEIYKKYRANDLRILGLTNEQKELVVAFSRQIPILYSVAFAPEATFAKFGVSAIPYAFLVDKNGVVVWQGHPRDLNFSEIEKVLQ